MKLVYTLAITLLIILKTSTKTVAEFKRILGSESLSYEALDTQRIL
jgi:hypothetical protein